MTTQDNTPALGRRQVLGLAAAGAALGLAQGAKATTQATPAPMGAAARGPGIPTPTAVVATRSGAVQGLVIDGVNHFRGIRYGAPPIGPLRWAPPQPAKAWKGTYDATDFGAPAMQLAGGSSVDVTNDFGMQMHRVFTTPSELKVMNEDCLYLNVWTPAPDAGKRPVMVWIHGGGYAYGSTYREAYPTYSPTYLWEQMISGRVMLGSETLAGRKAAKGAAPAYVYMVAWETPVSGGAFKTPHTMEIPFMLYSYDKVRAFVGPEPGPRHMADQIGGAWVAFARTGKPDHAGIPHWPAFNVAERPVMVFNTKSAVVNDPLPKVRRMLETLPQAMMLRG